MPTRDVVVQFKADVSQFNARMKELMAQLGLVRDGLVSIGSGASAQAAATSAQRLTASYKNTGKALDFILQRMQALQKLQTTGGRLGGRATAGDKTLGIPGFSPIGATKDSIGEFLREDTMRAKELRDEMEHVAGMEIGRAAAKLPASLRESLGISEKYVDVQQKLQQLSQGDLKNQARLARLQEISARKAAGAEVEAGYKQGALGLLPSLSLTKIKKEENAEVEKLRKAQKALNKLNQQEANLINQSKEALRTKDAVQAATLQKQLRSVQAEKAFQTRRRTEAKSELDAIGQRRASLEGAAGVKQDLANLADEMGALDKAQSEVFSGKGFKNYESTFTQLAKAAENSLEEQAAAEKKLGDLEQKRLSRPGQKLSKKDQAAFNQALHDRNRAEKEGVRLLERANEVRQRAATRGLPTKQSVTALEAQARASMNRLSRTMLGAFEGFGRRFEATLQFAISGALIFGVQRLVREFVQTAIEVERAFKDIGTALEFDISAPRGTTEFERQVESLRREILAVAEDYNVLPTEANKAAFVMVSRFGETENAVKALRSQLLATKVSGIDQTEVLRALTAVAEGFAAVTLDTNESLSLQEQLLRKEAKSAELYAEALDLAVFIQQKFGIETEDVLEGTARATEVFKIMGFTMQETAALVSAVSRQLGQTGVQAAERLVRSIGQLTATSTRNALLELAAASDTFTLSIADFGSGQEAWEAIANQFDRIQAAEPGVAAAILQIVGQRREAEAVAAALGTIPLQQSIIASSDQAIGAAERRFQVLRTTVAEQIEAIKVGFQELAQNVERLGLLTPLTLMLSTLEGILKILNTVIKGVHDLITAIDSIPILKDLGLSKLLRQLLAITLALGATKKLLAAAFTVAPILASGRARAAAAAGIVAGGATRLPETVALKAATKTMVATTVATSTSFKAVRASVVGFGRALAIWGIAQLKWWALRLKESRIGGAIGGAAGRLNQRLLPIPIYAKASAALKGLGAQAGALLGKYAGVVGAAGILVAAFFALRNAGKDSAEALQVLKASTLTGQAAARAAAIEEDLTPTEQTARAYSETLEELNRQFSEGEGLISSSATAWRNLAQGIFGQDLVSQLFGDLFEFDPSREGRTGGQLGLFRSIDTDDRKLIRGSEEWWRWQIEQARKAWAEAQIAVLAERRAALPADAGGDMTFQRALLEAANAVAQAETPEEMDAAIDRIVNLGLGIDEVEKATLKELEGLEATLKTLQSDLARIDRQISLGQTTRGAASTEQRRISGELRRLGDEYMVSAEGDPDRIAEAEAFFAAADQALLAAFDNEKAVLDRAAQRNELVAGEASRLRADVRQAKREMELAIEQTGKAGDDYFSAWINWMKAMQAVLDQQKARRRQVLESRLGLTQSTDDWLNIIDQLIRELRGQQGATYDIEVWGDLERDIQGLLIQRADRVLDETKRLLVANAQLKGPIRSEQNALEGQIAALRADIESGIEGAELAEAQVALAQALASSVELEIERIAASLLLQAGVADSVAKLNARLLAANEAMEFAAIVWGENTSQWSQAALAVEDLQYQIGLSAIELDILTQRLGSDITDPYIQAQIDLAEVLARLNSSDLGELEKARLEGEKQAAEARVKATEISGKLFNYKFLYETDALGLGGYLAALEGLKDSVDLGTQAGKEAFLEIQALIDGLTDQASDMAFNVPTSIRLPTIFEVRRALAADQLGVNYQDNRQQDIYVNVRDEVDLGKLLATLDQYAGGQINTQSNAYAAGGAGITLGGY